MLNDELPDNDFASKVPLMTLSVLDWIALIIVIVGGLNWGLVGLMNIDLIGVVLGEGTNASRLVQLLVGAAAVYSIYFAWRLGGRRRTDVVS